MAKKLAWPTQITIGDQALHPLDSWHFTDANSGRKTVAYSDVPLPRPTSRTRRAIGTISTGASATACMVGSSCPDFPCQLFHPIAAGDNRARSAGLRRCTALRPRVRQHECDRLLAPCSSLAELRIPRTHFITKLNGAALVAITCLSAGAVFRALVIAWLETRTEQRATGNNMRVHALREAVSEPNEPPWVPWTRTCARTRVEQRLRLFEPSFSTVSSRLKLAQRTQMGL